MHKQEFLNALRQGLTGLPQNDIEERITFYGEMIDDRMEEGLSEEKAVEAIGPVDEVVSQIVEETPLSRIVKEKIKPKRKMRAWEIVLLILGFPLWFPLLITALVVVFTVYVVIWVVIVSFWAAAVSVIAAALGCLAAGVVSVCRGDLAKGALAACAGLVLAGLSVFLFLGCLAATRGAVLLTKKIALGIKSLFVRKEDAK